MTDFLNSNFLQTLILCITVIVTLWIYFANRKQNIKTARNILSLQIKDIEANIEFLIAEGVINGILQEKPLHYSTIIYDDNYWVKYNHLIAGRVDSLTYEAIDNFYKIASKIKEQQLLIKNKLSQSMEYRTMYYYNGIFSRVNGILDKPNSDMTAEQIVQNCRNEISTISSLYSDGQWGNLLNQPAYVQIEFVCGLTKMLDRYQKLTDGVAYRKLLKIK